MVKFNLSTSEYGDEPKILATFGSIIPSRIDRKA